MTDTIDQLREAMVADLLVVAECDEILAGLDPRDGAAAASVVERWRATRIDALVRAMRAACDLRRALSASDDVDRGRLIEELAQAALDETRHEAEVDEAEERGAFHLRAGLDRELASARRRNLALRLAARTKPTEHGTIADDVAALRTAEVRRGA